MPIERSIAVATHGRYLIVPPEVAGPAPILAGFHGYAEDAETQLGRLRGVSGSERCLIVSIQGLHSFYNRRTNQVVASWMTKQNRDEAIADNIAYVKTCLDAVADEWQTAPVAIFAGFSQGVAMAFRAAAHVLIGRGTGDAVYSDVQFGEDESRLRETGVNVRMLQFSGGHEWPADFGDPLGWLLN